MRTFIVGVFAIALATVCQSSVFGPNSPLSYPVLIQIGGGTGSGCIIQVSNSVFLLTAKHVLFEPVSASGTNTPHLHAEVATALAYSSANSTNEGARVLLLNLVQLLAKSEIRYTTNRDIALVRFEIVSTNGNVSTLDGAILAAKDGPPGLTVQRDGALKRAKEVELGSDVYVFGYPSSLTAPVKDKWDVSKPLLRKGVVAGVDIERQRIVIDAPSYFGNSGGPVVEVTHNFTTFPPSVYYRLLGVVSEMVPYQDIWENKNFHYVNVNMSNSGYTFIEPIDLALDLAW